MKTMLSNLKRLLRKRNSSGFTLIEVVIAMALLGILVTGVIAFMSPIIDMIRNNKNNARATLLSESINSYVLGNLRSAYRVDIIAGDNLAKAMSDHPFQYADNGTKGNITIFMGPENRTKYELRCMAMAWLEDTSEAGGGHKKLMLINCKVDPDNLKVLSYEKVFDDSMYSQLYPTLELHPFLTEAGTKADAYEVISKVSLNPGCYDVTSEEARSGGANFTGTTYVPCENFKEINKNAMIYSPSEAAYPSFSPTPPADQLVQKSIELWKDTDTDDEGNLPKYFYPDTFIFYVVKIKADDI